MLAGGKATVVPVSLNEMLLRGCTLKNSGRVLGLVVYTGPESRIQMNAAAPPRKTGGSFVPLQILMNLNVDQFCLLWDIKDFTLHAAVHEACSLGLHRVFTNTLGCCLHSNLSAMAWKHDLWSLLAVRFHCTAVPDSCWTSRLLRVLDLLLAVAKDASLHA